MKENPRKVKHLQGRIRKFTENYFFLVRINNSYFCEKKKNK